MKNEKKKHDKSTF